MAVAASASEAQAIRSEKPTGDQPACGGLGRYRRDQSGRQRGQHPRRDQSIRRQDRLQDRVRDEISGAGGQLGADDIPIEPAALQECALDDADATRQEQRRDRSRSPGADPGLTVERAESGIASAGVAFWASFVVLDRIMYSLELLDCNSGPNAIVGFALSG